MSNSRTSSLRAQRSNPWRSKWKGGLLRCARNDGKTHLRDSRRMRLRELCLNSCRLTPEKGAGNAGRSMRPRSRVQDGVEGAHEHTGHTGYTRHSPRNGFTAYFVLSPEIGLVCLRRPAGMTPRDLTPASRRQDHTTSPSAFSAIRQGRIHVHRIPPRVRDDRETPLWWDGTERDIGYSEYSEKQNIFSSRA